MLAGNHGVKGGLGNAEAGYRVLVKDDEAVYGDGSHGVLRLAEARQVCGPERHQGGGRARGQGLRLRVHLREGRARTRAFGWLR